jgi:TRAP-type C4-dicarboxylate transport system substrate-binding protein
MREMFTIKTRLPRWLAVTVVACMTLAGAACGASSNDKAGGTVDIKPRVLTLASPTFANPQISAYADELSQITDGKLTVEIKGDWRRGDTRFEARTIRDVKAGKVDMAWVGARVFDTLGVESFQALVAPLLIDSYELEARVFEQGIPQRMVEAVDRLGVVGIGVLPGPMRKLLGLSHPFVHPRDFAGEVVGMQDSEVARKTLKVLGARPRSVTSGTLDGLDGYEQQLQSIEGNSYDAEAEYVTANINLWPRPLAIVMGEDVYESLSRAQQSAVREAATGAIPEALAASRAEDEEAAPILCRRGMTFAFASGSDLAALRAAFEPVYSELETNPGTKAYLDAISSLKKGLGAPAEAPECTSESQPELSAATIPGGTYETTITSQDWERAGWGGHEGTTTGRFQMIVDADDGTVTIVDPDGEIGYRGNYTGFRDQIEVADNVDTINARWSVEGKVLRFTDMEAPIPFAVVWGSHPWVKVAPQETPIDGVWEFTSTAEELRATGSPDIMEENYGSFRWVLDGGRFEMTQKNGASDRWTMGTYVVRDDIVEFTVEQFGGKAPNNAHERTGEVFTFRWNLYRDRLTLNAVQGSISPAPFLATPWTRVD